jgi:hypothetical protein
LNPGLPKYFISEKVSNNSRWGEVLNLPGYRKGIIYDILNNENMKIHEEHMTPNSQFQKKYRNMMIIKNLKNSLEIIMQ